MLSYYAVTPSLIDRFVPKLETVAVEFGHQWKTIVGVEHLTELKDVQYSGHRKQPENAVKEVEKLNKRPVVVSEQITVRLRYWD
jgi:hypothetical protein